MCLYAFELCTDMIMHLALAGVECQTGRRGDGNGWRTREVLLVSLQ